jgi:hypothetical protein
VSDSVDDQTETETADNPGPPLPPVLAGRFRIGRLLGRGGMGRVFEAMDEKLKVPVALKLLVAEVQGSPSFLEELRREIVITRKITHPNVCRVYDLGTDGQLSFLTMELVEGQPLDRVLVRGPLPPAQVGEILEQVCLALEAAHREGVVHRDLKPSNVMLDSSRKVTVMDFGLARDLGGAVSLRAGPIGTPAYWAPEQARGLPSTLRTDLYAVGLIAYEMFTGARLPHALSDDTPLDEVSAPFRPVLRTCLQVDPARRYDSAAMLRRAIHDARTSADFARARSKWPLAAAGAAAVTLALGGAIAARAHRQRPEVSQTLPVVTPVAVTRPATPPAHAPDPAPPIAADPPPPPPSAPEPASDDSHPRKRSTRPGRATPQDGAKLDRNKIPVFE